MLHGQSELPHQLRRLANRQTVLTQAIPKTPALQEFHADVRVPFVLAHRVDAHHPRVVQPRHRFRFSVEAIARFLSGEETGADDLDRPESVQTNIPPPVNDAHSAFAKLLE